MQTVRAIPRRWALRRALKAEQVGDWHGAAAALRTAVRLDRSNAHLHFRLGRVLERSRRWEAAAEAYRAAIALDGERADWRFRLGWVLERSRRWEAAAEAYGAAIALDGGRARWHSCLGRVLERSRRWEAAAEAYRAAIALDATVGPWHERLVGVLRRAGDTVAVADVTTMIRERQPEMSPVEQQLLAADPQHFEARRQLVAFVTAHLDEINGRAHSAQPASAVRYRVWVYWGQGMAEAPPVVRRCHDELVRYHGANEVVVLDDDAVDTYADLPGYVHDRTRNNRTKFSDVLRLDLLARHGGAWLDATCLVRENVIARLPELLSSGFFAPRYRPARISSWFMASPPGHPVIEALRWAQIIYWRHHDRAIDYYVLHHLFEALSHLHPDVMACCQNMPWMSSQRLTRFRGRMLQPYHAHRFRELLDAVPVHKLTYRISPEVDTSGTMLDHLLRTGAPDADCDVRAAS